MSELFIPFDRKEEAKKTRCLFNVESKTWFIKNNNERYDEMVQLYSKRYLKNDYDNKELYKANEARWSPSDKKWFTYSSNESLQEYFE